MGDGPVPGTDAEPSRVHIASTFVYSHDRYSSLLLFPVRIICPCCYHAGGLSSVRSADIEPRHRVAAVGIRGSIRLLGYRFLHVNLVYTEEVAIYFRATVLNIGIETEIERVNLFLPPTATYRPLRLRRPNNRRPLANFRTFRSTPFLSIFSSLFKL